MKRRIGSFFYKSKPRQQEIARRRWDWPTIIGRIVKKTCMVLGAIMLIAIIMGLAAGFIVSEPSSSNLPDDMVLVLNITQPVGETQSSRSLTSPLKTVGITVQDLVETLDKASADKRVRGLLVSLDNAGMELAHIQELRAAVKRFRTAGKFAYIYTASFADLGSGIGAYYFASAFDQIWMQPVGFVAITGLALEMPFGRDVLDKFGVKPEFLHREEYKSAMESFTNSQMSAPNREMMTLIVNDFAGQIFGDIAQDRKLKDKDLENYLNQGLIPADAALKAGLVDKLGYADELLDLSQRKITGKKHSEDPPIVEAEDYFDAMHGRKYNKNTANVALVRVNGEIVPGSEPEPGYATGDYIASAIQEAADSKKIKVIVVRVDSPGGSPSASETIRRAIVYAKKKGKKVIVSMGPVAASGGYWLTVDADKIFALPSTLTGSIGVIMGKFEISGLWKKVGVNWDSITWGKNARMWSMNAPLDDNARATLNTAIDSTYNAFIERVATGRHMNKEEVRALAKGRAWTGAQAKKNGLVDEIGGLDSSLDYAAKLVGASNRGHLRIVELPEPLSPLEEIMQLMGDQVSMGHLDLGKVLGAGAASYLKRAETIQRSGPVQAYDPDLMGIRP